MSIALLFESMSAAASIGIGCGTCCGSGISAALYSYLTTHTKNIKQSIRAFLDFFFGKLLAVILLCSIASCVGRSIIDDTGRIMGVKTALITDTVMLAMGIWFLIGWIRELSVQVVVRNVRVVKLKMMKKLQLIKSVMQL